LEAFGTLNDAFPQINQKPNPSQKLHRIFNELNKISKPKLAVDNKFFLKMLSHKNGQ
jgi:hypothetical protein